ncbi:hypothetical protein RCL_jg25972.t1 [Rhizophagus clarus]|uniref:Uncharacterized protein n=1 Tax=Rhizophagus clarus TaxID=94130 RepID=A0A8H3L1A7_9GLOM|nr:hypothetical protein RCL_jg25972.t1 [Rhizophagus clarus]
MNLLNEFVKLKFITEGSFDSLIFLFYVPIFVIIWIFYLASYYRNRWDRTYDLFLYFSPTHISIVHLFLLELCDFSKPVLHTFYIILIIMLLIQNKHADLFWRMEYGLESLTIWFYFMLIYISLLCMISFEVSLERLNLI